MRPHRLTLALSGLLLSACLASPIVAQKSAKEAEAPEDDILNLKYTTPGDEHRLLEVFAGNWEANMRGWTFGTPPPEIKLLATMRGQWVKGGRYVAVEHVFGAPEAGLEERIQETFYLGYSLASQKYVLTMFNNEDTWPYFAKGDYDAPGKKLTLMGTEDDPVSGDSYQKIQIFDLGKDGEIGYELRYRFVDGSEIRAAEGVFRRK